MEHHKQISLVQLNELNLLVGCLSTVSDLMSPEPDLHAVNRDRLALLLGYLSDRMETVLKGME
jgi:hypothetical protein